MHDIDKYIIEKLDNVPPQHGALLPSEMLAFIKQCLMENVAHVIESGRRHGFSTECLAQFDEWHVTSIERDPLKEKDKRFENHSNVTLLTHKAEFAMPAVFSRGGRTGVLLDGPKGMEAYNLYRRHKVEADVWAIHDTYPGTEIRRVIEEREDHVFFTDDDWFLRNYGTIDAASLEYRGYKDHSWLSEANVLAVIGRKA